ncbi:hypothetical protein CP532_4748 [Ophiocordyceps camponoti-leonardi (nom. inval.)]|nr:hypothetical protein CP532_4748 [Ophiocordyceps camponoti-leonardi (nom. inval.)]
MQQVWHGTVRQAGRTERHACMPLLQMWLLLATRCGTARHGGVARHGRRRTGRSHACMQQVWDGTAGGPGGASRVHAAAGVARHGTARQPQGHAYMLQVWLREAR